MTAQLSLFLAPSQPPREARLWIVGKARDCSAALIRLWEHQEVRTAGFLCSDNRVEPVPMRVIWATPRAKLPADFLRQLEQLERVGWLTEWQPPSLPEASTV